MFQETYHSIADVGTLLFQLGDVGKQFFVSRDESDDSLVNTAASLSSSSGINNVSIQFFEFQLSYRKLSSFGNQSIHRFIKTYCLCFQSPDKNGNPNLKSNIQWYITVDQFLATVLNAEPLVNFFSKRTSISDHLEHFKNKRFNRLQSFSDVPALKVQN